MSDKHTELPWIKPCEDEVGVISKEDDQTYGMRVPILTCYSANAEADAELIVTAVNNHYRLVEALRPFAIFACSPDGECDCNNCTAAAVLSQLQADKGGE